MVQINLVRLVQLTLFGNLFHMLTNTLIQKYTMESLIDSNDNRTKLQANIADHWLSKQKVNIRPTEDHKQDSTEQAK